jgi:tetratricopeptide (TPR) repeat protein
VTFWSNTLRLDPGARVAYGNLGAALINEGRHNEAWFYSLAQVAYNPSDPTAAKNLRVIKEREPGLKPDLAAFWLARAESLLAQGYAEDAYRLCAKALTRAPRSKTAQALAARAAKASGRLKLSEAHASRA